MAIRTKQLALVASGSTSLTTVYTCPSGHRTIVKDIALRSTAASPGVMLVRVADAAATNTQQVLRVAVGAQNEVYRLTGGFIVMNAGDVLAVQVGGGSWTVLASGAELVV